MTTATELAARLTELYGPDDGPNRCTVCGTPSALAVGWIDAEESQYYCAAHVPLMDCGHELPKCGTWVPLVDFGSDELAPVKYFLDVDTTDLLARLKVDQWSW